MVLEWDRRVPPGYRGCGRRGSDGILQVWRIDFLTPQKGTCMLRKFVGCYSVVAVAVLIAPLLVLAQEGSRRERGDIQVTNDWDNTGLQPQVPDNGTCAIIRLMA